MLKGICDYQSRSAAKILSFKLQVSRKEMNYVCFAQMYNGTSRPTNVNKLCHDSGVFSQRVYFSTAHTVTLRFVSDTFLTSSGFQLTWQAIARRGIFPALKPTNDCYHSNSSKSNFNIQLFQENFGQIFMAFEKVDLSY